jgi:two-component system response regulator AtoC
MKALVLVVEDDAALNAMLCIQFEDRGFDVEGVGRLEDARRALETGLPNVMLLDQQLPDGRGLDLLQEVHGAEPDLPVIMMTGLHDLELAIMAIQKGAFDFVHKPIQPVELGHVVDKALEHSRLVRKSRALDESTTESASVGDMIGQSRAMLEVSKEIALVADSDARVLLSGESGTGKEVVARAIHSHSGRAGPFLAVNCAAIVDTLLESELFGHEKGAFTGAVARKEGKFELATDGTLFLDEVGELAMPLQAKLLRVVQEGIYERVGGTQQLTTRARLIAATNRDLRREVEAGRFREDLLYRLDVIQLRLPPLRERLEDVPLLVEGLMQRLAAEMHRRPLRVTDGAMKLLRSHDWPGNVRELENVLTQALIRGRGPTLTPELLALDGGERGGEGGGTTGQGSGGTGRAGRPLTLEQVEARHVQYVLDYAEGHKGRACDLLQISRPALDRKIRKHGLLLPQSGAAAENDG